MAERGGANQKKDIFQIQRKKAFDDMSRALLSYSLWGSLGWQDIKQRYRRSSIGPFWITLSLGLTVAAMGVLYAKLFHQDIHAYLPYLSSGMVIWSFLSGIVNESPSIFISAEGIIKQIPMPYGVHAMRMIWRNTVIFFHNMIVVLLVMGIFDVIPRWNILLFPFALVLTVMNGYWIAILLGIFGARYRDIVQIVNNIVQIFFFLTPVMWTEKSIHHKTWILDLNPFYHVLNIMRNTLLGGDVPLLSWGIVFAMTIIGWFFALWLLSRYRRRISYWL